MNLSSVFGGWGWRCASELTCCAIAKISDVWDCEDLRCVRLRRSPMCEIAKISDVWDCKDLRCVRLRRSPMCEIAKISNWWKLIPRCQNHLATCTQTLCTRRVPLLSFCFLFENKHSLFLMMKNYFLRGSIAAAIISKHQLDDFNHVCLTYKVFWFLIFQ